MIKMRSKFEQIYDYLTNEVLINMNAGDRLPTETKLAKDIGVSRLTLSKALSALESEGRVIRRQGSGTFACEAPLDYSNEKHIAVLIDQDISHPQLSYAHRRVMETLLWYFAENNIPAKRYTGRKPPWQLGDDGEPTCDEFMQAVENDEIKAVVLPRGFTHPKWAAPLQQRGVPIIGEWGSATRVVLDYPYMIDSAVNHLQAQGRKNIALLEWHHKQKKASHTQNILDTFRQSMKNCGMAVNEQWIRCDMLVQAVGAGWGGFREIWSASKYEKPDGLIVIDDLLFRDAASAILEMGIEVPQQLAIVTQANKNSGMFYPLNVSKLENDPDDVALGMGEIALRVLENKPIDDINTVAGFNWINGEEPDLTWNQTNELTNLALAV